MTGGGERCGYCGKVVEDGPHAEMPDGDVLLFCGRECGLRFELVEKDVTVEL